MVKLGTIIKILLSPMVAVTALVMTKKTLQYIANSAWAQRCMQYFALYGGIHQYNKQYQRARISGDIQTEMRVCYELGRSYFLLGQYGDAITFSINCFHIAIAMNHQQTLVKLHALYKQIAREVERDEELHRHAVDGVLGLSICLRQFSDIGCYGEEYLRLFGDEKPKDQIIMIWLWIGVSYNCLNDYDNAILYSTKCIDIAKDIDNREVELLASYGLERAKSFKCSYEKQSKDAILHGQKAVEIAERIALKPLILKAYLEMADLYSSVGQYRVALPLLENVIQIAKDTNDKGSEMNAHIKKATFYYTINDQSSAISTLETALAIAEELDVKNSMTRIYLAQVASYRSLGKNQEAVGSLKKYFAVSKEIGRKVSTLFESMMYDMIDLKAEGENLDKVLTERMANDSFLSIELRDAMTCFYDLIAQQPLLATDIVLIIFIKYHEELKLAFTEINGTGESFFFSVISSHTNSHIHYIENILQTRPAPSPMLSNLLRGQLMDWKDIGHRLPKMIQIDEWADFLKGQSTAELLIPGDTLHRKALELSLVGVLQYIFGQGTKAETSLRQAVKLFELIFNDLQVDGQQISLVDREIDTYKMLFKVLMDMGKHIDALLVAERCRAKALKYRLILKHKTIEDGLAEDEVTTNDIRTLVITGNYAILFYTWCFNDLYIFLVQSTKDDNGEDEVFVHRQYYKNFRKVLNAEIINAFGQMNVAAALDSYANRREDVEEDQDESTCRDYCCGAMRAGPPSENDDNSNYGGTTSTSTDSCRSLESLEKLHQWLLSPFLSKITAPEIVIIPEGSLYLLPFAALRDPATKRYLSQDKRLRFSPSLTNLTLHHRVPEDYYSHSGSLIIGDPTNDEIPDLIDLPGSHKEAVRIAELIGGVRPLIGRQATKSAVLERLPEVCIVHLACHISLSKSVIILAPNDDTGGAPIDEDDYLLKAEDVTETHARLVVLSGCNSGRGKVSAEGVVGIARAFLAAGARAVLVSRWKVGDNVTLEFMETFYTYLLDWDQQRRSASESLHLTINDMREKYPQDPMKWSGFFLMGDDVTIDRERLSVLRETGSRRSVRRHSWEFPS